MKTRILPILDEIIAYFHNKSHISKNHPQKNSIFQQPVAKNMRSLKIFDEIIVHLRNHLQCAHFKKIGWGKKMLRQNKCVFMQPIETKIAPFKKSAVKNA